MGKIGVKRKTRKACVLQFKSKIYHQAGIRETLKFHSFPMASFLTSVFLVRGIDSGAHSSVSISRISINTLTSVWAKRVCADGVLVTQMNSCQAFIDFFNRMFLNKRKQQNQDTFLLYWSLHSISIVLGERERERERESCWQVQHRKK